MVQKLYDQDILIYLFSGLSGLGVTVRLTLYLVYHYLIKQSDNMGVVKNKSLKLMKMKFETCYKLKFGVNNVDTFVDKSVYRYRFCGIKLSTWENFSGQIILLSLLMVPLCAIFGVAYECGQDMVYINCAVGMLASAILLFVDRSINLPLKKQIIKLNIMDYLENYCKVRMEQENTHPEVLDQYKKEYMLPSTAAEEQKKETKVSVLEHRREEKRKREEEKRQLELKKEEEQRRLKEAHDEEVRRRLEEKKRITEKRREEELQRLEEEKEALESKRLEAKKREEEKKEALLKKQQKVDKEKLLKDLEEELKTAEDKNMDEVIKGMEEIAAEIDKQKHVIKRRDENDGKELKLVNNSQEDKIIEDVLKEFFA